MMKQYKNCLLKTRPFGRVFARGQGLEPRYTGPEPVVLPLDDPRIYFMQYSVPK